MNLLLRKWRPISKYIFLNNFFYSYYKYAIFKGTVSSNKSQNGNGDDFEKKKKERKITIKGKKNHVMKKQN